MKTKLIRLSIVLALLAAPLGSSAANLVVTNLGDSGPGTLRSALANADNGAVITFDPSLSGMTNILTSGELLIPTNLTIDASALPGGFKISGNQNSRVFELASNTVVTLSSLTIQDGLTIQGGGIYINSGAGITLTNCTLFSNTASGMGGENYEGGGGIYVEGGTVTINASTFSSNSASHYVLEGMPGFDGGGILVDGGTVTINGSMFSGNSADGTGGGIYLQNGAATLNGSTISSNIAFYNGSFSGLAGGGVYVSSGPFTINGSIFSRNSASFGGGVYADAGGTLTIEGSTFSSNGASSGNGGGIFAIGPFTINSSTFSGNSSSFGGGIYFSGSTGTINGSTFYANSARGSNARGGGVMENFAGLLMINNSTFCANSGCGIFVESSPGPQINNSTFSGNLGGGIFNDGGDLVKLTNTIVADTPGIIYSGANNLTNGNPLLAPLGNYGGPTQTMPPLPGSPAIGAGSVAANTLSTDQRGYPRTQNGLIDIGAVELQPPAANPPVLKNITVPTGGGNGLQFTFTNAPAADFTVLTATNVSLALTNWTVLGEVQQVAPGQYQFTDPQAATNLVRFYRVRSP